MKKLISSPVIPVIMFLLFLIPIVSDASYLIRLKNGGKLTTPRYWVEGKQTKFYYLGGIAGVEKDFISKIEKSDIDEEEKTVSTVKPEPLPAKTEAETKTETGSTTVEVKKDDRFMKEFSLLAERAKDVSRMTTDELYKFSDDLIGFRDKVLGNRLGHIYTDELLEIYAILDKIEDTIKARGQ
jgi:hypothetical protein